MKLYISGLSVIVLALFYLPLIIWALLAIGRSKTLSRAKKALVLILVAILAYAIPLGDVTLNSIAMAKVCPTAGLHVYKTVKVEGYFDRRASDYVLKKYPYRFIEYERPSEKIIHLERKNEDVVQTILEQPTAEYEVVYTNWTADEQIGVERLHSFVRNRATGEVIAEQLLFDPKPGWLDQVLVLRWFGGRIHGCHGVDASTPIAYKVLLPKAVE